MWGILFWIWISTFPTPLFGKAILSPLCFLGILVKDQLARYVWIYFLALYYVPYISISVFMPVLYSFHCSSFVIYFEFRKYDASSFVLILKDWFGYLWSFVITYEFWNQIIFFYFWKKCHWNVMKIKNHRYHLTPVRMDIMKKNKDNMCWQGCEEIVNQEHCL